MPRQNKKSKLYTRTGDRGETSLLGGRRVRKDAARVGAYGTVDELNSALGVAAAFVRQRKVVAVLKRVQNELFNIGAELASDQTSRRGKKQAAAFRLAKGEVAKLEALIEEYDARTPPLQTFVLPSGSPGGSLLHLARTVCRRAEREVVTLARREAVNPAVLTYLNRLSDLLFALARYVNRADRRRELRWQKDG